MTYRFKSLPVVAFENVDSARPGLSVQVTDRKPGDLREHELELSAAERSAASLAVAEFVFAGVWGVEVIATALFKHLDYSFLALVGQQRIALAVIGAACAFWLSMREELKFRLLMKALADRNCGWLDLRIWREGDPELTEQDQEALATSGSPSWAEGPGQLGAVAQRWRLAPRGAENRPEHGILTRDAGSA